MNVKIALFHGSVKLEELIAYDLRCNRSKTASSGGSISIIRKIERHAAPQQADAHKWESCKKQVSATKSIDGIDGRNCEDEVGNARTHTGEEGLGVAETGLLEDGRRVVGNDLFTCQ
jgi:hypothetical protein